MNYEITISLKVESERPLSSEQVEGLRENAHRVVENIWSEGAFSETDVDDFFDDESDDSYLAVRTPVTTIKETV